MIISIFFFFRGCTNYTFFLVFLPLLPECTRYTLVFLAYVCSLSLFLSLSLSLTLLPSVITSQLQHSHINASSFTRPFQHISPPPPCKYIRHDRREHRVCNVIFLFFLNILLTNYYIQFYEYQRIVNLRNTHSKQREHRFLSAWYDHERRKCCSKPVDHFCELMMKRDNVKKRVNGVCVCVCMYERVSEEEREREEWGKEEKREKERDCKSKMGEEGRARRES